MSGHFERQQVGMGMSMSPQFHQEVRGRASQEHLAEGKKDEVISSRTPIPGFGQPTKREYNRSLSRYLRTHPYVVETFVGLPNSGKSTVMSQRAAEVEEMLAKIEKRTGRHITLRSLSWGDFIVPDIGGDIALIGHIPDLQPTLSARLTGELDRVIGRANEYWMVEVPGVVNRGESTVQSLVQNHGAFVDTTIADEELRTEKLAFRVERQSVQSLEELLSLYRRHEMDPNFCFDEAALAGMSQEHKQRLYAEIMAKVRRMGATPDGIKAVDDDADAEMMEMIRGNQILLFEPGYPEMAGFTEEHWNGVLKNPQNRRKAVAQLYQIKLRDQFRARPARVFIGENDPVPGKKNVRMDVLKRAEVPVEVVDGRARLMLPNRPPGGEVFVAGRR